MDVYSSFYLSLQYQRSQTNFHQAGHSHSSLHLVVAYLHHQWALGVMVTVSKVISEMMDEC